MGDVYYVWSVKTNSWVGGASSPYTSDIRQAKPHTREEALKYCRTRFGGMAETPAAFPISEDILLELRKK